jgi:hypothetical protein
MYLLNQKNLRKLFYVSLWRCTEFRTWKKSRNSLKFRGISRNYRTRNLPGIPRNFSQFRTEYGIDGSKKNRRNSVSTEFRGHPRYKPTIYYTSFTKFLCISSSSMSSSTHEFSPVPQWIFSTAKESCWASRTGQTFNKLKIFCRNWQRTDRWWVCPLAAWIVMNWSDSGLNKPLFRLFLVQA